MNRAILANYIVLVLAIMAWAHGDEQHVMGTVAKVDGMSITVKATDGSLKTVMIMPETKFLKNGSAAKLEDLKVGDRVVIHAKPTGDILHATEVKMGEVFKQAAH